MAPNPDRSDRLEQHLSTWLAYRRGDEGIPSEAEDPDLAAEFAEVASVLELLAKEGPKPPRPDHARRIGPYELEQELGRGGMGVVYAARQPALHRQVALKVMNPGLGVSGPLVARFRREGLLASRLKHPGICAVHDAGEDDGVAWIAMDLVAGESLAALLQRRHGRDSHHDGPEDTEPEPRPRIASAPTPTAIAWREDVDLLVAVADALHAAHEAGVVHRDVKPANIMVTPEGRPVVMDFGLARPDDEEAMVLTASGDVLGTPAYLAPEVISGGAKAGDRRADVWALGVTAYEMLTGERPFEGATRERLLRRIMMDEPRPLRDLVTGLPRDLEVVLGTALEKEPDRRYRDMAHFRDDLRRVREGRSIAARPPSVFGRLSRWARRRPAVATLSLLLLLLIPTLVGLVTHQVATAPQRAAGEALERRTEADRLTERGFALLPTREHETARELFEEALVLLPEDPYAEVGRLLAIATASGAEAVARELPPARPILAAHPVAVGLLRRRLGLDPSPSEGEPDPLQPQSGIDWFVQGEAAQASYDADWEEALDAFEEAIAAAERPRPLLHSLRLRAAAQSGRADIAERAYASGTRLWPEHPAFPTWGGLAAHEAGQHEVALERFRRAHALDASWGTPVALSAQTLIALQRLEEARAAADQAIALAPREELGWLARARVVLAEEGPKAASEVYAAAIAADAAEGAALMEYGNVLLSLGEVEEAEGWLKKGLAARRDAYRGQVALGALYVMTDRSASPRR